MPRTGRPKAPLILTDDERETLVRWSRRAKSAQALALRCRIVLACATGATNKQVAAELGVSLPTVGKWRSRFVTRRLEGLVDEPRPGAPRTITDEQVEGGVVATMEETPKGCDALVAGVDGQAVGTEQVHGGADLEGVSAQAASDRHLQAVQRSAVHREGPRRGRTVPGPAGAGAGAVRGREVSGPGAGPVPAGPADDARACLSGAPMTTSATGSPVCSPLWTSRPGRSSGPCTVATARWSSAGSWPSSTSRFLTS